MIYGFNALTGGTEGCLDAISGAILGDGDMALGRVDGVFYTYILDADSGLAESSPQVIAPDSGAESKRWIPMSIAHKESIYFPIAYAEGGSAPPALLSSLSSTNRVAVRAFDGVSNEDVFIAWQVPYDLTGSTIAFRVLCWVPGSTPPAENAVIAFSLAGTSVGNSELLSKPLGTAVTSSITCAAGYAQYDRIATDWSAAVTVTDLAAGETVLLQLARLAASTDTYAQDIGVQGVEIKYSRLISNA